jgi:hypothetical protein
MACRLSNTGGLRALIAAIQRSPIVVRLGGWRLTPAEWTRIRTSPQVDGFVLAWIASHVPGPRRARRIFM